LLNTIVALNTGNTNALDVSGAFSSLGHNLIGAADGSSGFPASDDLVGSSAAPLDPRLGALANNSGPTLTMALLAGSPAIDAADTASAPTTDQRGVPRPIGLAADVGAFEYGWSAVLHISHASPGSVDVIAYGHAGLSCRLFASSNLLDWIPAASNQIGSDGTAVFHDICFPGASCRFYLVVIP
jgi:hypothetical protein